MMQSRSTMSRVSNLTGIVEFLRSTIQLTIGLITLVIWRKHAGPIDQNVHDPIRAAGGLLWRQSGKGFEIAVVHRNRYDDWTLPKGKLKECETWQEAALREVQEETGWHATITEFAGAIAYHTEKGEKVVYFWHMEPIKEG